MQKKPISRRRLLAAGLAAGAGAAVWRWWPEQGIINPCRAGLPPALANHEIVQAAWQDIDAANVWDCHAHLVGSGDSGGGIWINPQMESLLHPMQFIQRLFYLNAGCAHNAPGRVDQSYVERMHNLLDGMRPGVKLLLLAFDFSYRDDASAWTEASSFHTPNEYAARIARDHPQYFEWAASVHPYRHDCVAALEQAALDGARAVKWLPAAMNIDPASPRCDGYYETLKRLDLPLITHGGMERAVHVGSHDLGNPLRLRRALDHGVRVVVAHCASLGEDRDTDRGPNGPMVPSFALFTRLMDEIRYEGRLFGELSAMTQLNRAGAALAAVVERGEWHHRLLNGSDYPLPGIMPLYSVNYMVELKYIKPDLAPVLSAIRQHNPLLFDFVLKRNLEVNGRRLATRIFETRAFFARRESCRAALPATGAVALKCPS
jgi:mannonate dehydratase